MFSCFCVTSSGFHASSVILSNWILDFFLLWLFLSYWCWVKVALSFIDRMKVYFHVFMFLCFLHPTSFCISWKQGLKKIMHLEGMETWKHENIKICLPIWNIIVNQHQLLTNTQRWKTCLIKNTQVKNPVRVFVQNRIEEHTQSCIIASCTSKWIF